MRKKGMLDSSVTRKAIRDAVKKLNPLTLWHNPVMLVVEIGSIITTANTVFSAFQHTGFWFDFQISVWLWATVLFANFAEALAEGRGKAQADSLKKTRNEAVANRLRPDGATETVAAVDLIKGDIVIVTDNDTIPSDGEIVEGVALVDESAVTGESAPVIRESGGDRTGVTGGTHVLSGTIRLRITANMGDTFLDQMIAMVESSSRRKTPNEIALEILLVGLTALFLVVTVTLQPFAGYMGVTIQIPVLVALLVCLMPTTIGGLLPAIGIAGMDRLIEHNVIALSGRAVEASGDVSVVLLDKTGTITLGNRMATEFLPADGVDEQQLIDSSVLASLADDTPEGRSIVTLAKQKLGIRGRDIRAPQGSTFIPFTADTRMSGIDYATRHIRKGAVDAIKQWVEENGGQFPDTVHALVDSVGRQGETPLVVSDGAVVMGVIRLKDILKQDIKERLGQLHAFGIKSVMITGDNPLTAAAIAAEAGIDDFVAQARPETKLNLIRQYQENGNMVAMIGDGTNDAPALAQADVGVAMNAGTQSAREAANLVDLDSNPTKLLDIVEIGKQILITRGSLTTFSIANDVAKYFAIIPAIFAAKYPQLAILNVMHLHSPASAILSAVIFNALIIPSLIPLAMRGVQYHQSSANALLWRNLTIYGAGGLALPFVGIRLIDLLLVAIKVVR